MSTPQVRFRQHGALSVAFLIVFFGALPLATLRWYLTPLLTLPLLGAAWAWRSGTDADAGGLRVRALLGRRRIGWPEVAELSADRRGRALARLVDGRVVPLPAVTAADLPRLVAAANDAAAAVDRPAAGPTAGQ